METFSAETRRAALEAMASEVHDVLVIGGGITGAGIARDAAMRGLRVALVDAGDFARGTSSRSSCLIHGGLRYLEHGWLHLVLEASRERRTLLRIAPHLVTPRAFVFPVHAGARVRRWQIWAAVWLYDVLALFRNVGRHRLLSRSGVLRIETLLKDRGLEGGALYYDAQCDDARLTIATVRAAFRHGARCANYARVVSLEKAGGRVRGAQIEDVVSGRQIAVRAHCVVNATGPWSDEVRRLDDPAAAAALRPTKGAHVTVPQRRIGNAGAVTFTSPVDGRVMFILPWGDATLIGTTDTDCGQAPDGVAADQADVVYLLRSANALFPDARLHDGDVIAAWAALRPLLDVPARSASSVPREHRISEAPSGLVTVAGGKLTTYRVMAAQTVDLVARQLHDLDGRRVPERAATDREPLPGGEISDLAQLTDELVQEGLDAAAAEHLATTYGAEAASIARIAQVEPALGAPLLEGRRWIQAEVVHHARREMALTVSDVLTRRLHVLYRVPGHGLEAAGKVAELLGRELGWDKDTAAASAADYRSEVDSMRSAFRPAAT
jgi:glycerol-3-phosphate dehydrogenase